MISRLGKIEKKTLVMHFRNIFFFVFAFVYITYHPWEYVLQRGYVWWWTGNMFHKHKNLEKVWIISFYLSLCHIYFTSWLCPGFLEVLKRIFVSLRNYLVCQCFTVLYFNPSLFCCFGLNSIKFSTNKQKHLWSDMTFNVIYSPLWTETKVKREWRSLRGFRNKSINSYRKVSFLEQIMWGELEQPVLLFSRMQVF